MFKLNKSGPDPAPLPDPFPQLPGPNETARIMSKNGYTLTFIGGISSSRKKDYRVASTIGLKSPDRSVWYFSGKKRLSSTRCECWVNAKVATGPTTTRDIYLGIYRSASYRKRKNSVWAMGYTNNTRKKWIFDQQDDGTWMISNLSRSHVDTRWLMRNADSGAVYLGGTQYTEDYRWYVSINPLLDANCWDVATKIEE